MDCFPGVGAPVETFVILVVPKLLFPGSPGASVTMVVPGSEAFCVCVVAALGDATELLLLLSPVAAGVVIFSGLEVKAATVATVTTVGAAPELLVGSAGVLVASVGACGWVEAGLSVGLYVAGAVGAGNAAVVFAGVGACVDSSLRLGASVGGSPVVPPVFAFVVGLIVVTAPGVLPPVDASDCVLRLTL